MLTNGSVEYWTIIAKVANTLDPTNRVSDIDDCLF